MEKDTEENTNTNEGESLLKEIEINFKLLKKNTPKGISDQIQTFYDQFITLTKGSEKEHILDKLEILNTIVNNISEVFKSCEDLPKNTQKYLSELKKALYQLNTIKYGQYFNPTHTQEQNLYGTNLQMHLKMRIM